MDGGRGRAGPVGANEVGLTAYSTRIVPNISSGWKSQRKAYVPGSSKRKVIVAVSPPNTSSGSEHGSGPPVSQMPSIS